MPSVRFGICLSQIKAGMALAFQTTGGALPQEFFVVKEDPPLLSQLPNWKWVAPVDTFQKEPGYNFYHKDPTCTTQAFSFDEKGENPRLKPVTPTTRDSIDDLDPC